MLCFKLLSNPTPPHTGNPNPNILSSLFFIVFICMIIHMSLHFTTLHSTSFLPSLLFHPFSCFHSHSKSKFKTHNQIKNEKMIINMIIFPLFSFFFFQLSDRQKFCEIGKKSQQYFKKNSLLEE